MKTVGFCSICVLFFCILLTHPCAGTDAPSEIKLVDSIGTARIQGGNLAESREAAIQIALMAAIDRLISDIISSDVTIASFQALNENLFSKSHQFIQGYRVLTEGRSGDYYRVMIQAGVSVATLQKQLADMGVTEILKSRPSILLMIAEQTPTQSSPVFWWGDSVVDNLVVEEALSTGLSEKGFLIVTHGQGPDPVFASVRQSVEPSLSALADVSASLNAEYIILGKAIAQPVTIESGMVVSKGLLKIRLIRPKTGKEMGTSVQTATATHSDETIAREQMFRMLGLQAAGDMVQLLKSGANQPSKTFSMIDITVEGASHFKYYATFRKTLNSVTGVKTLVVKEMKPDVAILGADFQGTPQQLADALMTKVFDGFSVSVREISATGILLTITPKP
ncbi:MAG: hypothetical protein AB7S77_01955 [Desulfatirhabdiaceae bacterium]